MRNKRNIVKQVQKYFNNEIEEIDFDEFKKRNSYDRYIINTAKRLVKNYNLYRSNSIYLNDFLISFRDYLITFNVTVEIKDLDLNEHNAFNIGKDQNGYFARYQNIDYIKKNEFIKDTFLSDYKYREEKDSSNLYTNPFIYKLTTYEKFKTLSQKIAVEGALNTPNTYTSLISLPTGGGKSLVTQTMAYQREGLTVVIVPTVSLAIDQLRVSKQVIQRPNVDEEIFEYHSGVNTIDIAKAINNQTARLLFISPEALIKNSVFNKLINDANKKRYLKNIIIDEAHIVVDWGASFRIDYQCLESWRNKLIKANNTIRTILLSATFERQTVKVLKNLFSTDNKWIEIRCDALRHEPRFTLVEAKNEFDKKDKYLELIKKLPHPLIVYVSSPYDAEKIKGELNSEGIYNVRTFTGKTNEKERRLLIDQWVNDEFQIMVATSAFGVGVDKSDVRTVLHLYIPENPNQYYQELGRGGRDRLPCLSVMCLYKASDDQSTFNKVSKHVLTTEKIAGRWDSMFNNIKSHRDEYGVLIDTSIRPNYNYDDDYQVENEINNADVNWNIYVLLFLRRYNLIRIQEIQVNEGKYYFYINDINQQLLGSKGEVALNIEPLREQESKYYNDAYHLIKSAVLNDGKDCWSEMFYDTYNLVSQYCAGCDEHSRLIEYDSKEFPLKKTVCEPLISFDSHSIKGLSNNNEIIITLNENDRWDFMNRISRYNVKTLIVNDDMDSEISEYIKTSDHLNELMIFDLKTAMQLLSEGNNYYISGGVAVMYSNDEQQAYEMYRKLFRYRNTGNVKFIHIIEHDMYFESQQKKFTDIINGISVLSNFIK